MKSSANQITSKHRLISLKHMPFWKLSFHLLIISSLPVLHSTRCRLSLREHYDSIQAAVTSVRRTCERCYSNCLCIFISFYFLSSVLFSFMIFFLNYLWSPLFLCTQTMLGDNHIWYNSSPPPNFCLNLVHHNFLQRASNFLNFDSLLLNRSI